MVTLNELFNKLNQLKENGKIVDWKKVRDSGDVVIINVGYPTDTDVVTYENFAVRVYNRGTKNEEVKWERRKPIVVREVSTFEQLVEDKKQAILDDLKTKYNLLKVTGYTVDDVREYIQISGFADNGDGSISQKNFVVMFDEGGNYTIYELK